MAHEEVKALYEIDKQHSDTPWEYWEMKTRRGHWITACVPGFFYDVEYRRKPGAPVWPDDKKDARKWRELVDRVKFGNSKPDANFVLDCYLSVACPEPELIQDYAPEQWRAIIDGEFLCEFSDCEWEADSNFIISTLTAINETSRVTFSSPAGARYSYCRPLRTKGVRQPWFGGECPVPKDSMVLIKLRSGQNYEASTGSNLYWGHNRDSYDILEFIEL